MKIAKRCVACDSSRLERSPAILMPFVAARVFGWEPAEITPDWGLRDVPTGTALSVCQSSMCRDCEMLFLDMRFDDEEMGALYSGYRDASYSAFRARFEPNYLARNESYLKGSNYIPAVEMFLEKHVPLTPAILDWGGDTGINTPFRSRARTHDIFEISGLDAVDGARHVTSADIAKTRYDLITFMQVLEHVPAPRDSLRQIAQVMDVATVLYVELPYEELVRTVPVPGQRLAQKRHWHEHINFFSVEALDRLFAHAGLKIIERAILPTCVGGKQWHNFAIVAMRA